jgi:hypothetical protein
LAESFVRNKAARADDTKEIWTTLGRGTVS